MLQLFFFFPKREERIKRFKNNRKWAKPSAKTTNVKDDTQDNQSTNNTTQSNKK